MNSLYYIKPTDDYADDRAQSERMEAFERALRDAGLQVEGEIAVPSDMPAHQVQYAIDEEARWAKADYIGRGHLQAPLLEQYEEPTAFPHANRSSAVSRAPCAPGTEDRNDAVALTVADACLVTGALPID